MDFRALRQLDAELAAHFERDEADHDTRAEAARRHAKHLTEFVEEIRDDPGAVDVAELGDSIEQLAAVADRVCAQLAAAPALGDIIKTDLDDGLAVNRLHAAAAQVEAWRAQLDEVIALTRLVGDLRDLMNRPPAP